MGIIISVVNNKGGCGKTTAACNLADALGRLGNKVLVVDMDTQCNTTAILMPDESRARGAVSDLLAHGTVPSNTEELVYPSICRNVSVVANSPDAVRLEADLIQDNLGGMFRLRRALREYAIRNFDITIIDNPPNIGGFVRASLNTSDFVIVPVRAGSAFSIEGIINATAVIREVRDRANPDLRFLRLLINGVDGRTAICRAITDRIRSAFAKEQVFETEIPVNTSFEMAESRRQTIFHYNSNAKGARAFERLAGELDLLLSCYHG